MKYFSCFYRTLAIAIMLLCLLASMMFVGLVHAGVFSATGYAWSSNIGWISMGDTAIDGTPYAVNVDSDTGVVNGYGWSEHIGWIAFEGLSGCPAGTCNPSINTTTYEFEGWARACAGTEFGDCSTMNDAPGGWDGWISLNCLNTGTCGTSNYSWQVTAGDFNGFAWGGEVVGWIEANSWDTGVPLPTVNIGGRLAGSGDPLTTGTMTIASGDDIEIEWSSSDTQTCTQVSGSGFSTGGALSGTDSTITEPAPGSSDTFTVACAGIGGNAQASLVVENPVTSIDIWTEPTVTDFNNSVDIHWDATGHDPSFCKITGSNGFTVDPLPSDAGSVTSPAIVGEMSFLIECNANGINIDASTEFTTRISGTLIEG